TLRSDLVSFDVESLRIFDGGDFGDSYNYAPPAEDRIVDRPVEQRVEVLESSSLRARLLVERTYEWPRAVEADGSARSDEAVSVPLQLHAELRAPAERRAGGPFTGLRIAFDNPGSDHRVRVHVPLPAEADHTRAEGQFAIVERPPRQEGGHGEQGLGTYPACGFVAAGGIAL